MIKTDDQKDRPGHVDVNVALRVKNIGNQEAFAVFDDATASAVCNVVLQLLADPAKVEETTTHVFVRRPGTSQLTSRPGRVARWNGW